MKSFQKSYKITVTTQAPLYIGSGKAIGKKEYVFDRKTRTVKIINLEKFAELIYQKNLFESYNEYMCSEQAQDLRTWMRDNRITPVEIEKITSYKLDCSASKLSERKREINMFVKDPYGKPYVPGSSLKGCIRTALLAYDISKNPDIYNVVREQIRAAIERGERHPKTKNSNSFLEKGSTDLEYIAFNILEKNIEKRRDAVNDIMSGIIISDSVPLETSKLSLCQKIDVTKDGISSPLPIYYECIVPGTRISFTLTVDCEIFNLSQEPKKYIMEAVDCFSGAYYTNYLSFFEPGVKKPVKTIYLGGNCGYPTKTVMYNLFDKPESVELVSRIFALIKRKSKNANDSELGISPHMLKKTIYGNREYLMGESKIEIANIE